jgi:hypothetical protein
VNQGEVIGFEVLTTVTPKSSVFWSVRYKSTDVSEERTVSMAEEEAKQEAGVKQLWLLPAHLPDYTALHFRR